MNNGHPGGGSSAGTFNAACEFLERFAGVRWLMPGEHGDYVPQRSDLTVPQTDFSDAPAMQNRRVPYTQERRSDVKHWWRHQRLGWSLYLNHSHNWRHTIPPSHFEQHPEWFPLHGGVRVPPTGRYKLCTTNADLVRAYADATIDYFDQNPDATCYSLSPSDSAGYCECDECSALYENDPNGKRSVTPAILTFYNDVARLVAKKYPDKVLSGYVYADYLFPPKKTIKLEPNVFLVWAPSFDYGFTLARPALQRQWEQLLEQWTQVTHNIAYYDLPVNITTEAGAINPPGLEILKFINPRLQDAEIKGVYVYGISAWGRADYYHLVISAGTASFMVNTVGAAWAIDGHLSDQGLHLLGTTTPLYFYVADRTSEFLLSLEATPPGETAIATLYEPNGREVTAFDCTKISVDRQKIKAAAGQAGWWRLDVQKPPTSAIDDVWVKLEAPHSGYFSMDPGQAAAVR